MRVVVEEPVAEYLDDKLLDARVKRGAGQLPTRRPGATRAEPPTAPPEPEAWEEEPADAPEEPAMPKKTPEMPEEAELPEKASEVPQ